MGESECVRGLRTWMVGPPSIREYLLCDLRMSHYRKKMKEPSFGTMGKLVALITVATVILSAVAEEDAAAATQQKVRNTLWSE